MHAAVVMAATVKRHCFVVAATQPVRIFKASVGGGTKEIAGIVGEMMTDSNMMKRRLREGVEFFRFLRDRKLAA